MTIEPGAGTDFHPLSDLSYDDIDVDAPPSPDAFVEGVPEGFDWSIDDLSDAPIGVVPAERRHGSIEASVEHIVAPMVDTPPAWDE